MVFKRILHPVGQGAFFSEQFFDDAGMVVFNVVYDCGEKNTTKHLVKEIDNTFNLTDKPEVIDILFISHLDEDHINGISYLVGKKCLTKDSVVILPLHYPLVLKLILQQIGSSANIAGYEGLMSLFDSGAKILGVDDNDEVRANDALNIDEGLANVAPYTAVNSMQPLQYRGLWNYLPFNTILDDNRYQKFLDELKAAKIDRDRLADITYVQKHLDKLIDIYKTLPKSIGSVTAINVNSLNVLSYAANDIEYQDIWLNYLDLSHIWWHPWFDDMVFRSRCSCLYTGDCVMDVHFEHCIDSFTKYIIPCIGMLQIPHHGRATCYNPAIVQRGDILAGFTNFNSTHKANKFVKQIVHDFSVLGKIFVQITEHFHSRLELYVHLR